MYAIQLIFVPGPLVASPSAAANWECGCLSTCQSDESGGTEGCQLWVSLLDTSVISMTCVKFPMCTWLYILSCSSMGIHVCTDLFVYDCLGDSLSPFFLLCRWYYVCLPWVAPFVLGPVDSLLSSNAPPLTGSILGPQKLCSQSATGSSKRLKALRSGLWTQVLY